MGAFFESVVIGLNEAISIEKGEIPIRKKFESPAPTYIETDGKHYDACGEGMKEA